MLNLYRRHLTKCPHRAKGATYTKCTCPVWCDGDLNGKRYRKSLDTRDWGRAGKRMSKLEEPGARQPKPIKEAIEAFSVEQADKAKATRAKYKRVLNYLETSTTSRGLRNMDELGVEEMDAYHASRKISAVTWLKEIEILHQFFKFCKVRKWLEDNPAEGIKRPKNLKPNEVEPYTRDEVIQILMACDGMGRGAYERLRARALVLLLRYTALRIGDVATLEKVRVRAGEIHVRTTKTGAPVSLPVHPELQAALDILPAPRGAYDGKYFFWTGNGSPDSVIRAAERTLTTVFTASKVKKAHAHRFRHYADIGTMPIQCGKPALAAGLSK